jgi:hypothetical protein
MRWENLQVPYMQPQRWGLDTAALFSLWIGHNIRWKQVNVVRLNDIGRVFLFFLK